MGKEKIDKLIQEMSHYDPDNMQMAAKRVAEMVLAGEVDVMENAQMANTIREAFMKQIDSENDTVQSEAIKYLADIVPKLPGEQVEIIFDKILNYIIDLNRTDKKRERYGACAASVIHHAAPTEGPKLENLFLKSIKRLLEYQDKKSDIEMILMTIITQFLKKWPNVASRLSFDRRSLIRYLLRNVQVKEKLDIIRKTEYCLGKLTAVLDKEHVDLMLNEGDWGLLKFIDKSSTANTDSSLVKLRNGLLCLSQVIRTHNLEIRHWIKGCSMLLCRIIDKFRNWEEIEKIDVICDILDTAVTGLANTLKIFSRQLRDVLEPPKNPFNGFVRDLLNFNVEGLMGYVGEVVEADEQWEGDDEYQGDYYEEEQADEKCWKVRRSVLYYIPFLAKHDKNFMTRVGQGEFIEDLGNKMVQESSMVSQMAFFTFNELIELISVNRTLSDQQALEEMSLQRVKSNALEVAAHLISQITKRIKVIFNNAKFNDQLKIESSKILLRIIQIYNHVLITNEADTFSNINFILQELTKTHIQDNKINLLLALRELITADYPFPHYQPIYTALFAHIQAKHHHKLHAICFHLLTRFNRVFAHQVDHSPVKEQLMPLLKSKIKEMDSEKGVKQAVAKCVGSVFEFLEVSEDDWVVLLESISNKYKVEIDKLYLIEVLMRVKNNRMHSKKKCAVIETLIRQTSQNLGSTNYELNNKTISAIEKMLPLVWESLHKNSLKQLLERSQIILKDGHIPSFFRIIAEHDPKALKPYSNLIVRSIQSYYIQKLIQCGAVNLKECIGALQKLELKERGRKISQVLGRILKDEREIERELDESAWGKVLIGAMGYIGAEKTIPKLFSLMGQFKSEQSRFELCSAIGNIVSRGQDRLVDQLMSQADKAKDIYIYLYIFKEMLCYNEKPFKALLPLIKWVMARCSPKFEVDSNYFISAECVGICAFMSPEAARTVIEYGRSQNQNQRFIVANSLRFGLEHRHNANVQLTEDYVHTVVQLAADPAVRVREGSIKSLFSLAQNHPSALKNYSHDGAFWKTVVNNCLINDQLISIIDYGICKEVRDEGKNLRLQVFSLLQALAKHIPIDSQFIEELMQAAIQRIEEESSSDIVTKRLSVISHLCRLDFDCFLRIQNDFVAKLGLGAGVFKRYKSKVLDDRDEIFLRGILGEVQAIEKLAREEGNQKVTMLMVELRGCNNIRNLMPDSPIKHRE